MNYAVLVSVVFCLVASLNASQVAPGNPRPRLGTLLSEARGITTNVEATVTVMLELLQKNSKSSAEQHAAQQTLMLESMMVNGKIDKLLNIFTQANGEFRRLSQDGVRISPQDYILASLDLQLIEVNVRFAQAKLDCYNKAQQGYMQRTFSVDEADLKNIFSHMDKQGCFIQ